MLNLTSRGHILHHNYLEEILQKENLYVLRFTKVFWCFFHGSYIHLTLPNCQYCNAKKVPTYNILCIMIYIQIISFVKHYDGIGISQVFYTYTLYWFYCLYAIHIQGLQYIKII